MLFPKGFRHLVGVRYHGETSGMVFGFGEVGDKLEVSAFNSPPAPILRDESEALRIGFEDMATGALVGPRAERAAAAEGAAPATIAFSESGAVERLHRLPDAAPPTAEAGLALVGRYRCPDLDADATIAFAGETLNLRIRGGHGSAEAKLDAYSATVFGGTSPMAAGFGCIMTLLNGPQGVDGFRLSPGCPRGLRFERLADASAVA